MDSKSKSSRRLVVEEVGGAPESAVVPEVEPEVVDSSSIVNTEPVEAIKEKVEELQTITEHISDDVEKSVEVQEDIAKAAEEVLPETKENIVPVTPLESSQDSFDSQPKNGPSPFLIIVPGIFLLGALLGGIWFYQKGIKNNPTPSETPLETMAPSTTPSPSPMAKADLTKYQINIQNGSGIPGSAGAAKDLLIGAGFSVSATGNADTYDFTDTIIETKSDVPASFVEALTKSLSTVYKVGTPKSLPDSSTDEVVVIIGSSKTQ